MTKDREPFIVVPKPEDGWPDRTQYVGGQPYFAVGGELYAPPDPTADELRKLYAYWVSDESRIDYDTQNAWIETVGANCGTIVSEHFKDSLSGRRILDMAMGTGLVSLGLRRILPDCELTGFDLTDAMLRRARAKPELAGQLMVQADARQIPFRPLAFDAAVGSLFINHITDEQERRQIFASVHSVLRPGGIAIIVDTPNNPDRLAVASEIRGMFTEGFVGQISHTSPNAPDGFLLDYHVGIKR